MHKNRLINKMIKHNEYIETNHTIISQNVPISWELTLVIQRWQKHWNYDSTCWKHLVRSMEMFVERFDFWKQITSLWNCVLQLWFSCLWRNCVNGRNSVSRYQIGNEFNVNIKIRTMSTVLTYEFHNVLIWYAWLWDLFVNSHSLRIRLHPVGFYNKGFLQSNIFRLCND